jgi:hypothetical protein
MNPLTVLLETELGRRAREHARETAAVRVAGAGVPTEVAQAMEV